MTKTASVNINPLIESINSEFLMKKRKMTTYSPGKFENEQILPKRLDFQETNHNYDYELSDKVSIQLS